MAAAMDTNVWQQILGLLKEAQRTSGPEGWDTPAVAAAAIAAAAAAAEAAEAGAALRPYKKSRSAACLDLEADECGAQDGRDSSGHAGATTHIGSTSADGSEGHHFTALHHEDQATPTTLQGFAAAAQLAAAGHDSSPGYSHNSGHSGHQQQLLHAALQQQQQQQQQRRAPQMLVLDDSPMPPAGSSSPALSAAAGAAGADAASPPASPPAAAAMPHQQPLASASAAAAAAGVSTQDAAAAAAVAAAAVGAGAMELEFPLNTDPAALLLAGVSEAELTTQQRLVQVTMLDRLFDLTCTRFSIKDGVVAPRKFWPRVQHGNPLPIQMLLEVHGPNWDPHHYTSFALAQLGTAVRANRAAAAAAAEGNPAGYAAIWAQYLHVKMAQAGAGAGAGAAGAAMAAFAPPPEATEPDGASTTFGPYPAILVPGQNTFGGLLRIRNIKHHGQLKVAQSTPHVLVLREKIGADAIKLHIKLTKASHVFPSKKSSSAARLMGSLSSGGSQCEAMTPTGWEVAAQSKVQYTRLLSPSAAMGIAATGADGYEGSSRAASRLPKARARAEAAAAAAAAASGMGDGAPAAGARASHVHAGYAASSATPTSAAAAAAAAGAPGAAGADDDDLLAQALLDLKHMR